MGVRRLAFMQIDAHGRTLLLLILSAVVMLISPDVQANAVTLWLGTLNAIQAACRVIEAWHRQGLGDSRPVFCLAIFFVAC